jgi:hypothetical protein
MRSQRYMARERNILGRKITRTALNIARIAGLPREELLDLLDLGFQLPYRGGTTPQNQTGVNPVYFPRALAVTTDQTINQGDMVWWDSVNFTLKPLTNLNQVAVGLGTGGYCGIAAGTNNPGVYPNPPGGIPSEALPGIEVQMGGAVHINTTVGETYNPFQPVTVGADAQTVSEGAETTADTVGRIIVPPPVTARSGPGATPVPETVVGGTRPLMWIVRQYPSTLIA